MNHIRHPDSSPFGVFAGDVNGRERASALSWALHIIGDKHQPLHVSDQYSKEFPTGNEAGKLEWAADPMDTHI